MKHYDDFKKGLECPDCGQVLQAPAGGEWQYDPHPHTDPKDCIRYLRQQLEEAVSRLDRHNL